jgi:hypothetical protein
MTDSSFLTGDDLMHLVKGLMLTVVFKAYTREPDGSEDTLGENLQ